MLPIYEDIPYQIWFNDKIPEKFYTPADYLLFHLLHGNIQVSIGEQNYNFYENDLFIVHPGEAYIVHSAKPYLLCTVRMSFGFILRCCDYERPCFFSKYGGHKLCREKESGISQRLIDKIESLSAAFFINPRPSVSRLTYLFYDFAYFLIETYQVQPEHDRSVTRRIYQIRDFIETSFATPITLNSLAKALGITPQYLSGFIKKELGITFGVYLNKVRLNHAAYDLLHSRETVTQIMYKNGFPNATGFNQSFKKCYGMTPVQYRNLAWAKNQGQQPLPPDSGFTKHSAQLYENYISCKKKREKKKEFYCKLHLDSTKNDYAPHPWGEILNIGDARSILNIDYYAQLQLMQKHLKFKYARVPHLDLLVIESNFSRIDSAIDALKRAALIPWFVIQADSQEAALALEHFTGQLLKHGTDRYGKDYVSQWKLEYCMSRNRNETAYGTCFYRIYNLVKSICPGLAVGGPSLELNALQIESLFLAWQSWNVVPDFISLTAWPSLGTNKASMFAAENINENLLGKISRKIQNLFDSNGQSQPPIYIVDSGFVQSDNSYLNDALFMGNYIIKNYISMGKYARKIATPPLSDLTQLKWQENAGNPGLLFGGRGLMTATGIFKPSFFALKYLSQLGEKCLHSGENHRITMQQNGDIVILLYNYKHPDAYYCRYPHKAITLGQTSGFFSDRTPANFSFVFRNLEFSKYQVTRFVLNENFGSILDCWAAFGGISSIKEDTLNYLRGTLWPKMSVCELANDKFLTVNEVLLPQEIVMLVIAPLS